MDDGLAMAEYPVPQEGEFDNMSMADVLYGPDSAQRKDPNYMQAKKEEENKYKSNQRKPYAVRAVPLRGRSAKSTR